MAEPTGRRFAIEADGTLRPPYLRVRGVESSHERPERSTPPPQSSAGRAGRDRGDSSTGHAVTAAWGDAVDRAGSGNFRPPGPRHRRRPLESMFFRVFRPFRARRDGSTKNLTAPKSEDRFARHTSERGCARLLRVLITQQACPRFDVPREKFGGPGEAGNFDPHRPSRSSDGGLPTPEPFHASNPTGLNGASSPWPSLPLAPVASPALPTVR